MNYYLSIARFTTDIDRNGLRSNDSHELTRLVKARCELSARMAVLKRIRKEYESVNVKEVIILDTITG